MICVNISSKLNFSPFKKIIREHFQFGRVDIFIYIQPVSNLRIK